MNEAIYENNKRLLSLRYPKIAGLINERTNADLSAQVVPARDNSLTMTVEKNGTPVFIHSKYKPAEEARHWARAFSIHGEALFILFGFGMGYHVFEAMELLKEGNILIVFEPSIDIFTEAIKHVDIQEIIERKNVILSVGYDQDEIRDTMEFYLTWSSLNNTIVKYISAYTVLFTDEFKNITNSINNVLQRMQILKNTIIVFAKDWQYNLFRNIPYIFQSHIINDFYDAFRGKPAVIVSAGPSLNKNAGLLKEIYEKAVVICVDTALKVLLKEGITPHFVVTIDGSLENYEKFKNIEYNGIPLIYTSKCYHEILRSHTGEKVFFSTGDTAIQTLEKRSGIDIGTLDSGGSVANNAFDFALKSGADPVIFIGQDLAYTNNLTHAHGSMYDGKNTADADVKRMQVDGVNGKPVMTDRVFFAFKQWFEKAIHNDHTGRIFINATEGGANIEGTLVKTFRDAIDQYCREDISVNELIRHILSKEKENQSIRDEIAGIKKEFSSGIQELDHIVAKCRQGSAICLGLFNAYGAGGNFDVNPFLKKLDRIDKEIKIRREKFGFIHYLIQPVLFIVGEHLGVKDFKSESQKGMHIAKTNKCLYDGMVQAITLVKPWIKECIMELEELNLKMKEDVNGLES